MEFLRFGSKIPGKYHGCCAICIIQNFKVDPAAKASSQLLFGDGGFPITLEDEESGGLFLGPTYEDIFWQRIRIGTHSHTVMPNHAFLAVMTQNQLNSQHGNKWLKILKKAGFEFIRTVDNSVYTGRELRTERKKSPHPNHLFGLFRNIGAGAIENPFDPPPEWKNLSSVGPEAWEVLPDMTDFLKEQHESQLDLWNSLPPEKHLTEKDLEKSGVSI